MKKALIILNPVAGKANAKSKLFNMITALGKQDYETTVEVTKSRGHATEIASEYGETTDLMICCGGDGTLNEVIAGLLNCEKQPSLLYYPSGTTNDFASTLGLPKDPDSVMSDLSARSVFPLDVGRINDLTNNTERHFSYITSFGIFTRSSYAANQKVKNLLGHFAYVLKGMEEIGDLGKSYHVKIEHDNGVIDGNFILCAVTNSTSVGGVLKLSKDMVRLNDGLLEILCIKSPKSAADLGKLVSMLLKNKYDGENVIFVQTKKAKIHAEDFPDWCTDGEYAGKFSEAEVECLDHAINMIL